MDARLIVLGVSILIISSGFLVYGLLTTNSLLSGSALSSSILGLVFMSIGLTYRDPVSEVMKMYSKILSSALVKTFEDLGYVSKRTTFTCMKSGKLYLIFSENKLPCKEIKPGFGVVKEVPYLALVSDIPTLEEEDLESVIMKTGLAQVAIFSKSNDKYAIELQGLRSGLLGDEIKPLNPYQILIPLLVSSYIRTNIIIEEEEVSHNAYKAVMRVIKD